MKRIFAFVVTLSIAILSGCATIDYGDPNRPLPPQPIVSASIRAQLVGKSLKAFKVYTGTVTYYDASLMLDNKWVEKNKYAKVHFTTDFPKTSNPPNET
ncbi:MAG TPA: hypothetical protein VMV71_03265, partial [Candidatus Paceibacterota bacterium]|nr:hypothetical protein [Candidatus Paceibacterota bacterium]